ncbi:MAG: DUF6146 family protein [Bacteroidales bacterium]|nr:DUF6146 family protein [Bacteroidales bacterium]
MIRLILILASIIVHFSCGSHKDIVRIEKEPDDVDSVEYILIVDEIDFDSWMITNSKRIWYYSHEYYKAWNKIYVNEFNSRVLIGANHPFTELIFYNITTDYGIELDYRLYWYFMFIQKKYDVSLFASRYY